MKHSGLFKPNPLEIEQQKSTQKARKLLDKKTAYLHKAQEAYQKAAGLMLPFQDKLAANKSELALVEEKLRVSFNEKYLSQKKRLEKTIQKNSEQLEVYVKRLDKLGQNIKDLELQIHTWIEENGAG